MANRAGLRSRGSDYNSNEEASDVRVKLEVHVEETKLPPREKDFIARYER